LSFRSPLPISVPKRVGIFGGAFDPPHNGHVALARIALDYLQLDVLHVIPTGQAWHKARALSDAVHRLVMTRLAFEGIAHTVVDDRELRRAGPTFTIDTLEALQVENPAAQLYLIMGADQFASFREWHQWQDILEIAIICIAGRPQISWATGQFNAYNEQKSRFLVLPLPPMPVSATQIRQQLAHHADRSQGIGDLVPQPVARYISLHQLYSTR
jgi:nicotinate-nucleotide adenylyltransferase